MNCPFCKGPVGHYILVSLPILSSPEGREASYVAYDYTLAMLECPHCDMIFFLKASSPKLKTIQPLITDEIIANYSKGIRDISSMTPEEKHDLYEKMKKELIEKFT